MSGATRPAAALSVRQWVVGATGLVALAALAGIAHARTGALLVMHPSSMADCVLSGVAGVVLGWLAFAAAVHLIGRPPRPRLTTALGLSALARAALLPQAALLLPLGRELAKVELDIEAAIPLKLSSFTPATWALMAAYALAVIFALWAHAAAYHFPRDGRERFGTAGFLLLFAIAAIVQQALQWGLGRLVGWVPG